MDIIDIIDETDSEVNNQSSTGIDSDSLSLPFDVEFHTMGENIV